MEVLIQLLTSSPAISAANMGSCFHQHYWLMPVFCFLFFISAQRHWTLMNLHSSMRALVGAWGCGITPSSCRPTVRKSTSAGSGWLGVACSTWALRCAWAWPLVTSPQEIGLLWGCTPVIVSHPECAGPGTVAKCWTTSTTTFLRPRCGTLPPQQPLLQRSSGHCMVECRTCALKHIRVSSLIFKSIWTLTECL